MPAERDPYLAALLSQLAVSALLVVLCYVLVDAKPPFLEQLAQQYQALLTAEKIDLGSIPEMEAWKEDALDTCADLIEKLAAPRDAQPELDGQGGWFGTKNGDGRAAPTSCDFSPVSPRCRCSRPSAERLPPLSANAYTRSTVWTIS